MVYCQNCGLRNEPGTLDCSCGEPLPATLQSGPRFAYTPSAAQFALLFFVSGGLYGIYWFFKLWRVTAAIQFKDEHPWRNTLLMLVPPYNIYLYFNLFSEVGTPIDNARLSPRIAIIIPAIFGAIINALYRLPGDWAYVAFLAFVPFTYIQYYVTEAQLRLWGPSPTLYKYRWGDWLVIAVGGIILLLNLVAVYTQPADNQQSWVLPIVLLLALFSVVTIGRFKPGGSMKNPPLAAPNVVDAVRA